MGRIIYQEQLFSKWITIVLGVVTAIMLGHTARQCLTVPPLEPPEWFYPTMFLVFLGIAVNFADWT